MKTHLASTFQAYGASLANCAIDARQTRGRMSQNTSQNRTTLVAAEVTCEKCKKYLAKWTPEFTAAYPVYHAEQVAAHKAELLARRAAWALEDAAAKAAKGAN